MSRKHLYSQQHAAAVHGTSASAKGEGPQLMHMATLLLKLQPASPTAYSIYTGESEALCSRFK